MRISPSAGGNLLGNHKPDRFLAHVDALREFLHRFGRETDQEVVVVELSGADGSWFFRIKEFDD